MPPKKKKDQIKVPKKPKNLLPPQQKSLQELDNNTNNQQSPRSDQDIDNKDNDYVEKKQVNLPPRYPSKTEAKNTPQQPQSNTNNNGIKDDSLEYVEDFNDFNDDLQSRQSKNRSRSSQQQFILKSNENLDKDNTNTNTNQQKSNNQMAASRQPRQSKKSNMDLSNNRPQSKQSKTRSQRGSRIQFNLDSNQDNSEKQNGSQKNSNNLLLNPSQQPRNSKVVPNSLHSNMNKSNQNSKSIIQEQVGTTDRLMTNKELTITQLNEQDNISSNQMSESKQLNSNRNKEKDVNDFDHDDDDGQEQHRDEEAQLKQDENANNDKKKEKKERVLEYDYDPQFKTLQKLSQCCQNFSNSTTSIYRKFNRCSTRIQEKFQKIKENSGNKLRITSNFLFILASIIIVCIFYILFTMNSSNITKDPGFHDAKRYTSRRLISGSLIFTFYGIIFLQIENYLILYALFLFQFLPALFIFLNKTYGAFVRKDLDIDNEGIIDSSFVYGIYLFWLATWLIKEDFKKFLINKTKNIFLLLWCMLPAGVIAGYTIYLTSTTLELNFTWGYKLAQTIGGPYVAFLCLIWVYMHFRYFQPMVERKQYQEPKQVQIALNELQRQKELREQQLEEEQLDVDIDSQDDPNNNNRNMGTFGGEPTSDDQFDLKANDQYYDPQPQAKFGLDIDNRRQNTIQEPQIEGENNQEQQQLHEEPELSKEEKRKLKIQQRRAYMQNYIAIFTSMTLGGSMLFLTTLSALYVSHHLSLGERKNYENEQAFFVSLFMVIAVPLFIIVGTGVIFSKVSEKLKLILIPIFGAMIPLLFSVPLSLVIDYFVETRPLRIYFALGPAGVCIWMITHIYIGMERLRLSMILNSYICLFFLVPFLYVMPLRNNDIWNKVDDDIGETVFYGLFIAGIGIVFSVFSVQMIIEVYRNWKAHINRKKPKKDNEDDEEHHTNDFITNSRFELSNIFRFDLQFFGLWGNAFGYIITFTILIYMYYNAPDWITESQLGNLLGLQVTIIFLFFWCLIILLMRIISEKKKEAVSFSEQISNRLQSKSEKALLIDRQNKVRWSIVMFTLRENTIFCVVMMILFSNNEEIKWNFITMMIGIYIVGVIFCWLYVTKRNFDDFSKTAIPAVIVFSWIFLYLPFAGIIPTSIMYLSEQDEKLVKYERLVIGGTALLLLTGVALLGLLIHLYFKRTEFERKFKFIASKSIKILAKNHVKSDYAMMNLAFQNYVTFSREDAREKLVEGRQVFHTEVPKFDPDTRYSKMMIDRQTYDKLERKKLKKNVDDEFSTLKKFLEFVIKYYCCYRLCCTCGKKREGDEEENEHLLDNDDDEGHDLESIMDKAHNANLLQMEEEDLIEEEDPWMKAHLKNTELSGYYGDIIEAVRRYDLPQNLQISKPFQSQFLSYLFELFAQGSKRKFDMPWIDYIMFKQLMVLSHIVPSREISDHMIDKIYGKFTSYQRMANQNPITENRFTKLLTQIAVIKYPWDPEEHALGKLVKFWLFPYLLWYIKPLHGLYPHEWDYVLFLLKFYDYKDNHDNTIANDVNFRRDLEKYLGINQDADKFAEDDSDKKKGWSWEACLNFIKEWCRVFCDNWLYFLKSHMLLDRDMQEKEIDEIEIEVKMVNNTILKPVPFHNKRKKIIKKEESPEWDKVVDIMLNEMDGAEKEYDRMKDEEFAHMKLRKRVTTISAVVFKFIEIFSLGSLAFTPQVDWGLGQSAFDILNFFNTLSPQITYGTKYVISFIAVWVYLFVMYRSTIRIRHQEYGSSEENRRQRKLLTFDFVLIFVTNFISMVMGFYMIKIFFDTYSCDYSVKPQTMYQDLKQECFKGTHDIYFRLSIISLVVFYPMFCYLWPHVQFQNRSLDLKYDPTHQAILSNVKVIVASASAFFAHQDDAVYMLGISGFVLLMFGILTRKMKPCLIKTLNPLEMGGYYGAGWMHIAAIICKYSSPLVGWIVLFLGLIIIALISLGFWKILYDLQMDARKRKTKKIIDENGNEIEVEIDSDEEEEERLRKKDREKKKSLEYRIWEKTRDFKVYKEDKDEWLDENLIPYKDDELLEDDPQEGELVDGAQQQQQDNQQNNADDQQQNAFNNNENKDDIENQNKENNSKQQQNSEKKSQQLNDDDIVSHNSQQQNENLI